MCFGVRYREEILALLHHFGRLWADNSVFSLQLLNSFADVSLLVQNDRGRVYETAG